ncbi:DMT family transporter [Oceanobacillus halophilus]|uniref:EamA family transporter n=1 Tax=Oceanobacillus halophilus TaxID=930130 RepID=A0A495ABA3_9BACI|nr:DMT family transporter [Oceanobacillus halophilus]RKQ37331.1 EamA family transporter [Oceanobacillus halophilus]
MNKAFMYIIIGAALWGTIGWYVKNLYDYGFTPMEVVTLRVCTAAILLLLYMAVTSRKKLKLRKLPDIKYFLGTGIISIIFFNYCLFTAMEISTIPIATALLYTAPAIVSILSYFLFKESFTKNKLFALIITILGTCLVVGLIPLNIEILSLSGILFGLGSALGYALYSIFSKYALQYYSSLTITTYTFVVATLTLVPFFPFQEKGFLLVNPTILLYAFGLGFLPTAAAYIIYTFGLQRTEASKASILSTIEPVVATIIGIMIFNEPFSLIQMTGMLFIIGAVILVQHKGKNQDKLRHRNIS